MPIEKEPKPAYTQAEWLVKPRHGEADKSTKYEYKEGESLESIATEVSKPWKTIRWSDITYYNWGSRLPAEVNWYLKNHNGCTASTDGKNYSFANSDAHKFLWIPPLKREDHDKYRSPSKQDIGHVALDDESNKHLNTLIIRPLYTITLELGDVDALFAPIEESGKQPWESKGVQQRLQALGYLYAPLAHNQINEVTKRVWAHYLKVHTPDGGVAPTAAELKTKLKDEVNKNLLSQVAELPTKSGAILEGGLPPVGEFGAIRLPGGYCFTSSDSQPKFRDNAFKYELDNDRHTAEDDLLKHNSLLHKLPLIARVQRIRLDGTREPAEGVCVYFQLVKPDPWPEDAAAEAAKKRANDEASAAATALATNTEVSKTGELTSAKLAAEEKAAKLNAAPPPAPAHALRAPQLRDEEMDFAKDWNQANAMPAKPGGTSDGTWTGVMQPVANAAMGHAAGPARENYITTTCVGPDWTGANSGRVARLRSAISAAETKRTTHAGPYVVKNMGPKRFLDDLLTANPAADPNDPQKENVDAKFAGKRGIPVEGSGSGVTAKLGIFEIGVLRDGLHTRRDDKHEDYGTLTAAQKVTPTTETNAKGESVKCHEHAVRARTNDKGIAGVLFMPSRCGGDRYKIRAYVGPETIDFAGDTPNGPVAETGTLVVWRNVRVYKYLQLPIPAQGDIHADIKQAFGGDTKFRDDVWTGEGLSTGLGRIDFSDAGNLEAEHQRTPYYNRSGASDNYRTVNHRFIGFAEQLRRAYCEMIFEQPSRDPELLDDAEYAKALKAATDAIDAAAAAGKVIHWDSLLVKSKSPFLFAMRSWRRYNVLVQALPIPKPPDLNTADLATISDAIANHGADAFIAYLSADGVLPGLTLFQAPHGSSWDTQYNQSAFSSGVATPVRGGYVFYTNKTYTGPGFCYSVTGNTAHELGHVLFRPHQYPNPAGAANENFHQTQCEQEKTPQDGSPVFTCVMGYMGCFGEYCGRCVLALRGWKTKSRTAVDGA